MTLEFGFQSFILIFFAGNYTILQTVSHTKRQVCLEMLSAQTSLQDITTAYNTRLYSQMKGYFLLWEEDRKHPNINVSKGLETEKGHHRGKTI